MFYRPEFCCCCGEKVERIDWKPWTSRRFCQLCETKHPLSELIQKAVPFLGIVGVIIGLASFWPTSQQPVSPVTKRTLAAEKNTKTMQASPTFKKTDSSNIQSQPNSRIENPNNSAEVSASNMPKTAVAERPEPIYFCGAETKKGTPCTRKVKGNIRCWQHQGMPAMLPPSKLVVSN